MIKLSKNITSYRLMTFVVGSFPFNLVLLYILTSLEYFWETICSILLAVIFLVFDIYLAFYDFEIFYNPEINGFTIMRFGKVIKSYKTLEFEIEPYNFFFISSFQFYKIVILGERFRFKYPYIPELKFPFTAIFDSSTKIKNEIMVQIELEINRNSELNS